MKKNRCKYMLCAFGLLFHMLIYAQYNFSGSVVFIINPQDIDKTSSGTITDLFPRNVYKV